jgi:hypothetical protein
MHFFLHKTLTFFHQNFLINIMVKSFLSKKFGKMSIAVFAVLAFLTFSGVTAFAQEQARGNAQSPGFAKFNPELDKATLVYGIDASQVSLPGTWNLTKGRAFLEKEITTMRPSYATLSSGMRFRFEYFQAVLNDLGYDIAPEISAISNLEVAGNKANGTVAKGQFVTEYMLLKGNF